MINATVFPKNVEPVVWQWCSKAAGANRTVYSTTTALYVVAGHYGRRLNYHMLESNCDALMTRMFRKMAALVVTIVIMMTLMMVQETNAARILMAVPIGTKSHGNFYMPLAEHLAKRNHTVS